MTDPAPEYLTLKQVAEYCGVAEKTIYDHLFRGSIPEPDMKVFGRNLWLRETIVKWRKQRYKRRKLKGRKGRPRTKDRESLPRNFRVAGAAKNTIDDPQAVLELTDDGARVIAAALRTEGTYCTYRDVLELAAADPDSLDFDRRKLQQRVLRKMRGLKQRNT